MFDIACPTEQKKNIRWLRRGIVEYIFYYENVVENIPWGPCSGGVSVGLLRTYHTAWGWYVERYCGGLLVIALGTFWYVCCGILVLWWLELGHGTSTLPTRLTPPLSLLIQQPRPANNKDIYISSSQHCVLQCSSHPETGLLGAHYPPYYPASSTR